jgi:hypothetical protein
MKSGFVLVAYLFVAIASIVAVFRPEGLICFFFCYCIADTCYNKDAE